MTRLIEADELKKSIEEDEELKGNSLAYLLMNLMTCYIDDAPTIDAEPVRHGHWVTYADDKRECYCSNCEFPAGLDAYGYHNMKDPYCRFCGAKMDEVIE